MNMNGKSDPYVVVKIVDGSSKTTKVIRKTLDPTWNETLKINLKPEDKHKRLFVECWDKNTLSADDFMGRMSFGISANMAQDGWFKFLTEKEGELFNVPVPNWTE
jgi:Ca2+-dependent lipid-binding protein